MKTEWCEVAIGILLIVFNYWNTAYSQVIITILAAILIVHSFMCKCKCCECCDECEMPVKKAKKK